ncbi:isochorismatase family cysteine hydrolase [Metabacillus herbersteinensis]|uniref:Isochorismatase family cysteine hydrolase n=1 Tax=Metabacillus herbersteinensis TaxID=283816 RepID=A0ABV6GP42_9BACI
MLPKKKTALLIIDMINNFKFENGTVLAERANDIAQPIYQLKKEMKKGELPIVYINDHYDLWQANYEKIAQKCTNSLSQPIIDLLYPENDDYFLIKPKHSAFYGTALNTLLYSLGVQTLIITGIAGNICVLFTANDAYMREYSLIVPSDCITSNDIKDNEYALTMMKNVLKASVTPSLQLNLNNM